MYDYTVTTKINAVPSFVPEEFRDEVKSKNMYYSKNATELITGLNRNSSFVNPRGYCSSGNTDRTEWFGSSSLQKGIDFLVSGSPNYKSMLASSKLFEKKLLKTREIQVQQYIYATDGQFFDVGEVMSGSPEAFLKSSDDNEKEYFVDLFINCSYGCVTDASTIIDNGAKLVSVVKVLERMRIRTRIIVLNQNESSEDSITFFPIKQYGERFNIKKLSGYIHPSFLRRIMFRVREINDTAESGYGSSRNWMGNCVIEMGEYQSEEEMLNKLIDKSGKKL